MNKQELIDELKVRFFAVDEAGSNPGSTEAGITVWGIGVFNKVGDVVQKRNLTFYTDADDNAFWGVSEPNPTPPTPDPTFTDRVNTFIATKIDDGTIKFGYIAQASELAQKALCSVIKTDGSEKMGIISENAEGVFSIEVL